MTLAPPSCAAGPPRSGTAAARTCSAAAPLVPHGVLLLAPQCHPAQDAESSEGLALRCNWQVLTGPGAAGEPAQAKDTCKLIRWARTIAALTGDKGDPAGGRIWLKACSLMSSHYGEWTAAHCSNGR